MAAANGDKSSGEYFTSVYFRPDFRVTVVAHAIEICLIFGFSCLRKLDL